MRDEPITVAGDGTQTRSVCYVDDLVEGVLAWSQSDLRARSTSATQASSRCSSWPRWFATSVGSTSPIAFVPRPEDDPTLRQPDIALARSELRWDLTVDIDDGLKRTIEWFRDNP